MSRDGRLAELLQECLAAFETGLSPEECLAAHPEQRQQLEPLLRQALALRIAFAGPPAEAFRRAARESLLFAAGRDVAAAFAIEPDPDFTARTRAKLIHTAGAAAQEALRAVPPPRLPFWVNARRRLLEAAALSRRPAARPIALVLRASLSAAVVVLALALAGLGYVIYQNSPRSASADELAYLEEQTGVVEQKALSGDLEVTVLVDLTRRTRDFAIKVSAEGSTSEAQKLDGLIERQAQVVEQVSDEQAAPAIQEAKENLTQAKEVTLASVSEQSPPTGVPSPSATPEPTRTATPASTPRSIQLLPGQIRVTPDSDTFFDLSWRLVQTLDVRFVVPSDWTLVGVAPNRDGVAEYSSDYLRIDGVSGGRSVILIVNLRNGAITALIDNQQFSLRSRGVDGEPASAVDLVNALGNAAPPLYHIAESMVVTAPTPTPTPTRTPTQTPTATPANP